jgi:hypothetical protein
MANLKQVLSQYMNKSMSNTSYMTTKIMIYPSVT